MLLNNFTPNFDRKGFNRTIKMFKLVVLSVFVAIAQADVEKFLGKAATIIMSPNIKEYGTGCDWYTITKASGSCTCGDKTNVPLVAVKFESYPGEVSFAAVEVNTLKEIDEAVKTEKCKCTDADHGLLAFKEINDNYNVIYTPSKTADRPITIFLNVKTLPTQADLDQTLSNIPDLKSRTDYAVVCGLHWSS